MIGTTPSAQQVIVGRIVRMAGAGLTGAVAAVGMLTCLVLNARPRRTVGCIVESGPDPLACLLITAGAGLTAVLLACARTTTSGLAGGVLLGFAGTVMGPDEFAGGFALLLSAVLLVTAVLGKCLEEFPTLKFG